MGLEHEIYVFYISSTKHTGGNNAILLAMNGKNLKWTLVSAGTSKSKGMFYYLIQCERALTGFIVYVVNKVKNHRNLRSQIIRIFLYSLNSSRVKGSIYMSCPCSSKKRAWYSLN